MKVKLSAAFQDIRGKDGQIVVSKGRSGLKITPRTRARNPKSAAQVGVRNNLTRAAQLYKNMTTAQVLAWTNYANTIVKRNPISGTTYSPSPINAFAALATKFLQINPAGTVPMSPPTSAFTGDVITITATGGTGSITFTASAANFAGVKTELLVQPLKGKNRVPGSRGYRTKSFVAFASGSLTSTVTVGTGYYAAAYRFVNTATGQETALVPIGVQTVALSLTDNGPVAKKKAA